MTEVATTTQPTSRSAWFRGFSQEVLMPTAVLLGLVGIWEASVHLFSIPVYLLPAPSQIWVECSAMSGVILKHTLATLHTVLIGFLVSILISIPLAVVLTSSRGIATAVYPVLVITQAIPKVALAPLLVIILGANELLRARQHLAELVLVGLLSKVELSRNRCRDKKAPGTQHGE